MNIILDQGTPKQATKEIKTMRMFRASAGKEIDVFYIDYYAAYADSVKQLVKKLKKYRGVVSVTLEEAKTVEIEVVDSEVVKAA